MRTVTTAIEEYFDVKKNQYYVLGMPEEGNEDGGFRWSGCEILNNGLGTTVFEVPYLIMRRGKTEDKLIEEGKVRVCHEVLDAYHNGSRIPVDEDNAPLGQ